MSRPSDIFVGFSGVCYAAALAAGSACAFTGDVNFGGLGLGFALYGHSFLSFGLLAREDGL